jgi:hypothetical protein
MMRSGKAEDAMGATSMIDIAGRQLRSALAVVDTQLETWRVVSGTRWQWEARKDNKQALRSDCIRYDNANQRPQKRLGPTTSPDHQGVPNDQPGPAESKVNTRNSEQMQKVKHCGRRASLSMKGASSSRFTKSEFAARPSIKRRDGSIAGKFACAPRSADAMNSASSPHRKP